MPQDTILFGRNPVIEALRAHRSLNKILIAKGSYGQEITDIIDLARAQGVVYQFTDRRQLDALVQGTHQGVVAIGAERGYAEVDDLIAAAQRRSEAPFLVILDEVQDPHNFGSIIRSAEAMGVHGAIIPRRHAVGLTSVVAKASAGAIEYVPVARVPNVSQTLQELKTHGLWVIGLEADGPDLFERVDYTRPVALVIGSEGKGLRPLVRRGCDTVVRVPIGGHTGSLNAAVAAALVMYEVFRQRQKGRDE